MSILKQDHLGGNVIGGDPNTYFPYLWENLIKKFQIKSVLDAGCGEGYSLNFFKYYNIFTFGIDGLESNVQKCISMGHSGQIIDFTKNSFNSPFIFDMCWCCDVVQRIEEKFINNLMNTFKNSKLICITHANPNRKGYHYVNCKDWKYWTNIMSKNNFTLLKNESKSFRKYQQKEEIAQTLLIFENKNLK